MSATPPTDATTRFSSRVADYAAHRPTYPRAAYEYFRHRLRVGPGSAVADLGSGTGIFARPLLEEGCVVCCVEPNREMRQEAERSLSRFPNFRSIAGTAEATTLPDRSVDLVVAAQAFHWFDPANAGAECRRILKPRCKAALVWNTRKTADSAFLDAYEVLLNQYGTDYAAVRHDRADARRLGQFFPHGFERATFPHSQRLDAAGLRGRLLSSSYTPADGDPRRAPMLAAAQQLFDRFQQGGAVVVEYETELYSGVP
jgi:SAM-dependent methyltransferase